MSYNILIVDDSATMRTVIKRTVNMSELPIGEYFEAGNGKEALEVMRQNWIDLVLADINMPEMNGIEMTEQMQNDEELRNIPVVVVSTEASTTRIEQLKDKGVRGYIHKPFTPEKIRDLVHEILMPCK
ncbi:MAG: response regulator [Sedimentisphaerales bacterium]|nr:response regulator [Sedimentisphaerales bacterium]